MRDGMLRSSSILRIGVVAAVLLLAACGGSDAVKPAKLVEFQPSAQTRIAWRASAGDARPYVFSPALHEESVYAAGHSGQVARFDSATGKQLWRVDTRAGLSGGVGAGAGLVLVGTDKGVVVALEADGKERWRSQVSSEVLAAPAAAGDMVVARSGDGRIFGLDAASGERRWEYQASLPALLLRTGSGVTLAGNQVLAGLPGGRMVSITLATGNVVWDAIVAQPKGDNELERIADVGAAPLVVDDVQACAVAFQGRIACFDLAKGSLVWSRDASSASGLAADPLTLYMTDERGTVYAFDKSSGATVWKQDQLLARNVSAPAVVGEFVVVGDFEGYVHVLDRADGSFVARQSTDGSPIAARPLRMGDGVLVQTRDGGLYAIAIK